MVGSFVYQPGSMRFRGQAHLIVCPAPSFSIFDFTMRKLTRFDLGQAFGSNLFVFMDEQERQFRPTPRESSERFEWNHSGFEIHDEPARRVLHCLRISGRQTPFPFARCEGLHLLFGTNHNQAVVA